MDAPGNFGAVDGRGRPSLERVSDKSYRRGLVASLFVGDVLAGAYALAMTLVVNLSLSYSSPPTAVPHDFVVYWVVVGVLALLTFGIGWNVRAETKAGRSFRLGAVAFVLSLFPLVFGVAILFWTR